MGRIRNVSALMVAVAALLGPGSLAADVPVGNKGKPLPNGKHVCEDNMWTEHSNEELARGDALPHIQCWRDPPCIRWSWASLDRCRTLKEDADFPTWDPYLKDDPSLHTFKELVETFFKGKTVFWTGDSIMNLVANAAVCEAARVFDTTDHMSPFSGRLAGAPPAFKSRVHDLTRNMTNYALRDQQSGGQLFLGGPPHSASMIPETETIFVTKGWHKFKDSDMDIQMELADVIVVNYALHYFSGYHPEEQYKPDMEQMFRKLTQHASKPGKAAVFRDTATEHHAPFGQSDYGPEEKNHPVGPHGCQCSPLGPSAPDKADILGAALEPVRKQFPKVAFVPWAEMTRQRHDLHEGPYCAFEGNRMNPGGFCCDCTHYCYTPIFWKHFFSGMYDALKAVDFKP